MEFSTLFVPFKTVKVAGVAKFVARENFRKGETDGVRIENIGPNFKKDFLGYFCQNEKNVPAATLDIQMLKEESTDHQTLRGLGNAQKTFMAHCWELLKSKE